MKTRVSPAILLTVAGIFAGLALGRFWPQGSGSFPASAQAQPAKTPDFAVLAADVNTIKGRLTDQSHVMADVGYHFSNLWFAGQKKNWPLAKFYFDETRSHLRWAVRVIPVRKNNAGQEVDLKGILDGIDSTLMKEIGIAIEAKDVAKFSTAYRQMLTGCYACHKASDKPYLRPEVPEQPDVRIINFDPEAKWPQ